MDLLDWGGNGDLAHLARSAVPKDRALQRTAKNLFNYLSSFASTNLQAGVMALGGSRVDMTYVPLKAFEDWESKTFNRRLR
jgi:hypothetical protein